MAKNTTPTRQSFLPSRANLMSSFTDAPIYIYVCVCVCSYICGKFNPYPYFHPEWNLQKSRWKCYYISCILFGNQIMNMFLLVFIANHLWRIKCQACLGRLTSWILGLPTMTFTNLSTQYKKQSTNFTQNKW